MWYMSIKHTRLQSIKSDTTVDEIQIVYTFIFLEKNMLLFRFPDRASPKYAKCPKKHSVIKVSLESDLLFSDD